MIANTVAESTVLAEANDIIYGDREQTYGHPAKNLQTIADYWSAHLRSVFNCELSLTVEDVCVMMAALKLARLANTPLHRDSQVDACGYIALMERCQDYRQQEEAAKQAGA